MPLLSEAPALYVGDAPVQRVYLGDTLVWEPPSQGEWGPPESMLDPAVTPVTNYTGAYTTGARFLCTVEGRFTHLRSYNCDSTGTAFLRLWDHTAGQVLLAQVTVPPALGWQDHPLPTPIPAIAGHEYTVSFYNTNGNPTYPYAASHPTSLTPHLTNYDSPHYAGDTYPTTFGGECYWLDVVFQAVGGIDPDTQRFLDATGLPGYYAPALDGLVRGLKNKGLWVKMNAVYPFIGGTADFHKWNLMDPRDTDDAFRLTYTVGTGSHSDDLGWYADTHLIPAGLLDPASAHLSLFSLSALANGNRCDFGAYNWDGTTNRFHLIVHYMSGEFYYSLGHTGMNNTPAGDGSGLFTSSRMSMSDETAYLNGVAIASNMTAGGVLPPVPLYIGCLNGFANEYSDLPFGFVSIGSGLDAQNVADLNTVVQQYRLAVSNAHWTPANIPGLVAWIDPAQDTYADGERITSYREHSPAGREFVAEPNWEGPIFRAGGVPHLDFGSDGSDGGLTCATPALTFLDGMTLIAVCKITGGSYPMMLVVGPDADGVEMRFNGSFAQEAVVMYTSYGIVFSHPTPMAHTLGMFAVRVQPGVATAAWTDGVQVLGGAPGAMLTAAQTMYLGRRQGGYGFVGMMHEALIYNGPVSDADLALLTEYLATKHSLYAI
jgi:hypothetical protein